MSDEIQKLSQDEEIHKLRNKLTESMLELQLGDMNKKQAIKELLMKYTKPKPEYDGMFADTLARLILIAINDPEGKIN